MKNSLRKKTYKLGFTIFLAISFIVLVETGVFNDITNWAAKKIIEPLNLG